MFGNQQQCCHCGLPFLGVVLRLRQVGGVQCGVAQGGQLFALGD
jgi:hypothetical protein